MGDAGSSNRAFSVFSSTADAIHAPLAEARNYVST
jgi:hypothetical protein